jgi:hypothetical protein
MTRHPELKSKIELVLEAISNPDEVYVDNSARHALKRVCQQFPDS